MQTATKDTKVSNKQFTIQMSKTAEHSQVDWKWHSSMFSSVFCHNAMGRYLIISDIIKNITRLLFQFQCLFFVHLVLD